MNGARRWGQGSGTAAATVAAPLDGPRPGEHVVAVAEGTLYHRMAPLPLPLERGLPVSITVTDRALHLRLDGDDRTSRHSYWLLGEPVAHRGRIPPGCRGTHAVLSVTGLTISGRPVYLRLGHADLPDALAFGTGFIDLFHRAWTRFHDRRRDRPAFTAARPLPYPAVHERIRGYLDLTGAHWYGGPVLVHEYGSGALGPSYQFCLSGLPVRL